MLEKIKKFYQVSPLKARMEGSDEEIQKRYRRLRFSTFLSSTIGYALYHICRTSLNVVKGPILDEGVLNATQLGIISSVMLLSYAVGRFINGLLADHSNIKRLMAAGMVIATIANMIVGILGWITTETAAITSLGFFILFAIVWGINGWAQSMGASPATVGLSRWYPIKSRGTYYGFFSGSRNLGEFLSFVIIGLIISFSTWQWGFVGSAIVASVGIFIIIKYMHDSPESSGLPNVKILTGEVDGNADEHIKTGEEARIRQRYALRNRMVWLIALASAFMHISRYAINGWGVLFLQEHKGFKLSAATQIISISALMGVLGTIFSGWLSDKYFKGDRKTLALMFGVLNIVALILFLFSGNGVFINLLSMFLFGCSVGLLVSFLGGLMAVEAVPRSASGAALGVVGIVSYVGAGLQDIASGLLIESNRTVIDGDVIYNFDYASYFWIAASVISFILVCFVSSAKYKTGDTEKALGINGNGNGRQFGGID